MRVYKNSVYLMGITRYKTKAQITEINTSHEWQAQITDINTRIYIHGVQDFLYPKEEKLTHL